MTMAAEYGRCRNCGAVCDGDVCDATCAYALLQATRALLEAERLEKGQCPNCGAVPCPTCAICPTCQNEVPQQATGRSVVLPLTPDEARMVLQSLDSGPVVSLHGASQVDAATKRNVRRRLGTLLAGA